MTTTATPVERVRTAVGLRRRLPSPALRRAIRIASGLSCAEVAAALGITRQALSNYERGVRAPRGELLRDYIAVLEELQRGSS